MKTLWMDFLAIRISNAVHGLVPVQQTSRWDRLTFNRSEQEGA